MVGAVRVLEAFVFAPAARARLFHLENGLQALVAVEIALLQQLQRLLERLELDFRAKPNLKSVSPSIALHCIRVPTVGPVRNQLFGSLFRSLLLLNDNFRAYR